MAGDSLKRVAVTDVTLGMHLHALDGSWLDHPFWKCSFVLTDAAQLQTLQTSRITHCWIDVDKGVDVPVAAVTAAPAAPPHAAEARPAAAPPPPRRSTMAEELDRAALVMRQSRSLVTSIFNEARLGRAIDAAQCLPLVQEISSSVMRNPGALVSLSRLKTQDDYSYMHSVAVCALMVALARSYGFDEAGCRQAGLAGLLHDVGKAAMPLDVLNKPGRLTDAEFDVMRTHPVRGHAMLLEGGQVAAGALDVCLHHHEKIDGTGYPHGLAGDDISLLARMGAVCDVYDAVTSNRPYKSGWDPALSIARMASWKGHFDPGVFGVFVKSLGIYPVGSLVRLASGRLAVVAEHNPEALTAPTVRVFYSTKSSLPLAPETVDLARAGCSDRIVARESPSDWKFPHLDALWAGDAAERLR